jgi:putative transposase
MPRPLRTDFPGAWHHVMNRGADHREIFEHDVDYDVFLDALALASDRSSLEVHAYCLMTNHFHLLVRSLEGQLASGMQYLVGRFTRLINLRVGRDGPLFRGRYASIPVKSDGQLVQTCRYIHRNPVSAGMTSTPEGWRWSSAAAYVGTVQSCPWLKTDFILGLFGPGDGLPAYCTFMSAGTDQATTNFYDRMGW